MEEERYRKEVVVEKGPRDVDTEPDFDPGRIVYLLLDIIEALLLIRFILRAAGANPFNVFVSFIYALTDPLIAPFRGIFPQPALGIMVIEWSTVIALIIYALIGVILVRLLRMLFNQ